MFSIYKITNTVNNKIYIGFSSRNPMDRWYNHQRCAINSKKNTHLYNAMRKYGLNNFQFDIIYQSNDCTHTHKIMENYFIVEYRTYVGFPDCNGYNMTLGGEGAVGRVDTPETTTKRSTAKIGKKRASMTLEQKAKISASKKNKPWSPARLAIGYKKKPTEVGSC